MKLPLQFAKLSNLQGTEFLTLSFQTTDGPQFSGPAISSCSCQLYQFDHQPSSPHYPQSNGKMEKVVQTVKNLLHKSKAEKQDFYLSLIELRNTQSSQPGTLASNIGHWHSDIGKEDRSEEAIKVSSLLQEETKHENGMQDLDTCSCTKSRPNFFHL